MSGYIIASRSNGTFDVLWPSGRVVATFYGPHAGAWARKWCDYLNKPKESLDAAVI